MVNWGVATPLKKLVPPLPITPHIKTFLEAPLLFMSKFYLKIKHSLGYYHPEHYESDTFLRHLAVEAMLRRKEVLFL